MAKLSSLTTKDLTVTGKIVSTKHYYRHNIVYYIDNDSTGGGASSYVTTTVNIVSTRAAMYDVSSFNSYIQSHFTNVPLIGSAIYSDSGTLKYGLAVIWYGYDDDWGADVVHVGARGLGFAYRDIYYYMGNVDIVSDEVIQLS